MHISAHQLMKIAAETNKERESRNDYRDIERERRRERAEIVTDIS